MKEDIYRVGKYFIATKKLKKKSHFFEKDNIKLYIYNRLKVDSHVIFYFSSIKLSYTYTRYTMVIRYTKPRQDYYFHC